MPVRDSRRTGWPTASMVRRTMRFRPSCNVILTRVLSAAVETSLTDVGLTGPSSRRDALRAAASACAGSTTPSTSAR